MPVARLCPSAPEFTIEAIQFALLGSRRPVPPSGGEAGKANTLRRHETLQGRANPRQRRTRGVGEVSPTDSIRCPLEDPEDLLVEFVSASTGTRWIPDRLTRRPPAALPCPALAEQKQLIGPAPRSAAKLSNRHLAYEFLQRFDTHRRTLRAGGIEVHLA